MQQVRYTRGGRQRVVYSVTRYIHSVVFSFKLRPELWEGVLGDGRTQRVVGAKVWTPRNWSRRKITRVAPLHVRPTVRRTECRLAQIMHRGMSVSLKFDRPLRTSGDPTHGPRSVCYRQFMHSRFFLGRETLAYLPVCVQPRGGESGRGSAGRWREGEPSEGAKPAKSV